MRVNLAIFAHRTNNAMLVTETLQNMTPSSAESVSPAPLRVAVVGCGRVMDDVMANALTQRGMDVSVVRCSADGAAEGIVDLFDIDALRNAIARHDAVVSTIADMSFRRRDRERVWRTNVDGVKALCLAIEAEGIGRLVHLDSILNLGRQTTSAPVDIDTPYLSDDDRSTLEVSLFRSEMEAWKAAERGAKATTICAGWITDEICPMIGNFVEHGGRALPPMCSAFATANDVAMSVAEALTDGSTAGKRIICVSRNAALIDMAREAFPDVTFTALSARRVKMLLHLPYPIASKWLFEPAMGKLLYAQDKYVTR